MIDLFEKICYAFCGLIVLCVASGYLLWGTPSTAPREFLEHTRISTTAPKPSKRQIEKAKEAGIDLPQPPSAQEQQKEAVELGKALRQQGARFQGRVSHEWATVPADSFEHVGNKSNWQAELNLAKSNILQGRNGGTRVELTEIKPGSYLRSTVGLEEGDIIELIDGRPIEFDESSTLDGFQYAQELRDRLAAGGEVSLTITRGGKAIHRIFKVGSR